MPAEPPTGETGQDRIDALIDELIRDKDNQALIEAVFALRQEGPRASMLERFLLTETLTSLLSEALARSLADALTPRIMAVLGQYTTSESAPEGPAPSASANSPDQ